MHKFRKEIHAAPVLKEIVERLSAILVASGKSEKATEMFKMFGIDEGAMDLAATRALYARESPIWIDLASKVS